MTDSTFPVKWDLASLAPAPTTTVFRELLDQFKQTLANFAQSTNNLPAVDQNRENVRRWVTLLEQYEQLDAQATDLKALIECYMAADAECKAYQQLQAELATLTPHRELIATNIEFALKEASDEQFEEWVSSADEIERNAFFLKIRRRNSSLRLPKSQEVLAADLA
ncbi:MAG: M3 family oligoendopeptidase, partial [Planctomycetes bacterium]|nr:M3 family oligoendopeptidase [Planctomycetota bacterium]